MFLTSSLSACVSGLLIFLLSPTASVGKTRDDVSEVAAAQQEVIQTDSLTIRKLDLIPLRRQLRPGGKRTRRASWHPESNA